MYLARVLLFVCLAGAPSLAWAQNHQPAPQRETDEAQLRLLRLGTQLLQAGKAQDAIVEYFDKVIEFYDSQYKYSDKRVYGARTQTEVLMYLLTAAKDKQSAIAVKSIWGDAVYAKAYALIELHRVDEAKTLLERAVSISPRNSRYLAELGHVYQMRKRWQEALSTFNSAEEAAKEFSPPELKTKEMTRAMRGVGYVLIELQKLDEAEEKYRRCLELDNRDTDANRELRYIQQLRAKAGSK